MWISIGSFRFRFRYFIVVLSIYLFKFTRTHAAVPNIGSERIDKRVVDYKLVHKPTKVVKIQLIK